MVKRMLAKEPEERPTAEELVKWVEKRMPNEGEDTYKLILDFSADSTNEETIEEAKEK